MKRPYLVNFLAIKTQEFLSLKASVALKRIETRLLSDSDEVNSDSPTPFDNIRLLKSRKFVLRLEILGKERTLLKSLTFESDSIGNIREKISILKFTSDPQIIMVYEVNYHQGLEFFLGSFLPLIINPEQKLVICDFDKTLVDTSYSTTKEIYFSLTRPVGFFPDVTNGIELLKNSIAEGHQPFILSASPHFYEDTIRDWLYRQQIFQAGIFLKDYRIVFSLLEHNTLETKDIRVQGLYKLNHLLDILHMTEIPRNLRLIGDNFESDPLIYLILAKFLLDPIEPWALWNRVKSLKAFQLTDRQHSMLLGKFYHLAQKRSKHPIKIEIFIRAKSSEETLNAPTEFVQGKEDLIKMFVEQRRSAKQQVPESKIKPHRP